MPVLNAYAVHLYQFGFLYADHTFVAAGNPPTSGGPPPEYFACWGQHYDQAQVGICSGNVNYNRANCYRDPAFGAPDTAGIGIYAINGVCHQSANCFLLSANVTLK